MWKDWLCQFVSALSGGNMGTQLGRSQPCCRTCGKTCPRPDVTLSDFLPARSGKKKRNSSRHASPAISRRSSWVSWSDSPREQSAPSGEHTVMEDCTESHHADINKKIKANDKLRKILTHLPEEHTVLIYSETVRSQKLSLDDEKAALLAAERHFLPLRSGNEKTEELSGASLG